MVRVYLKEKLSSECVMRSINKFPRLVNVTLPQDGKGFFNTEPYMSVDLLRTLNEPTAPPYENSRCKGIAGSIREGVASLVLSRNVRRKFWRS